MIDTEGSLARSLNFYCQNYNIHISSVLTTLCCTCSGLIVKVLHGQESKFVLKTRVTALPLICLICNTTLSRSLTKDQIMMWIEFISYGRCASYYTYRPGNNKPSRCSFSPRHRDTTVASNHYNRIKATQGNLRN